MTMNLTETADERACKQHPDKPAEWMGELCQECWEELCAGDWWQMLRRAGL